MNEEQNNQAELKNAKYLSTLKVSEIDNSLFQINMEVKNNENEMDQGYQSRNLVYIALDISGSMSSVLSLAKEGVKELCKSIYE